MPPDNVIIGHMKVNLDFFKWKYMANSLVRHFYVFFNQQPQLEYEIFEGLTVKVVTMRNIEGGGTLEWRSFDDT